MHATTRGGQLSLRDGGINAEDDGKKYTFITIRFWKSAGEFREIKARIKA